jgi:O-antigen/teichoic acid export membrane protein
LNSTRSSTTRRELRKFGLLVGGIFGTIGLWPAIVRGDNLRLWAMVAALVLVVPAFLAPGSLRPVYRAWMTIGNALGWINTRIILGAIFFGLVTPMGLAMRTFRRDPVRRRFAPDADTYREPRTRRERAHLRHQY